jgi:hypothetical protein
MLALPIQAFIAGSFGWPAVAASGGICAAAAACVFAFTSDPRREAQVAPSRSSGLAPALLLQLVVAGMVWGAMNLACILFFSYAPLLMVAQGSTPTVSASYKPYMTAP